jgi:hypothetical protein
MYTSVPVMIFLKRVTLIVLKLRTIQAKRKTTTYDRIH